MKLFITTFFLFVLLSAYGQTLTLRPDYGNTGLTLTNISNDAPHFCFAMDKQSDGKMLLAGSSLIRLNSNGDIDSSFGVNGLAFKVDFPEINSIAVQADDRIITAASNYSGMLIKRFTAQGNIDSSFNESGIVEISETGEIIHIAAIKIQPDGKILLAGSSTSNGKSSFFIARYTTNGTPDASFNATGKLMLDVSAGDNAATAIATQSNGDIIIAGNAKTIFGGNNTIAVIRLNNNGAVDNSFSITGLVQNNNDSFTANLMEVYNNDDILLAGTYNDELLLMRLHADGALDNNFNNDGWITDAGLGINLPKKMEILNNNSIIVAGQSSVNSPISWQYAAFKFTSNGELDATFNGTGKSFLTYAGNNNSAGAVIMNDQSIFIGGFNEPLLFANTAKVNNNGTFDLSYGSGGINSLMVNGTDETVHSILKQADNKQIAVAHKTDGLASYYTTVLIRYNTNGTIDNSFGVNGMYNFTEPDFVYHSAVLQSDGKILLMGNKPGDEPNFTSTICVARINNNGTPDNSFGTAGKVILPSSVSSGYGKGLGLFTNGSIIVAGKDAINSNQIIVYRLSANGSLDNSFATAGKLSYTPAFPENGLGTVTIQPDNKILLGGYIVQSNGQSSFICLRFNSNGSVDNGFGTNGMYRTATSSTSFIELNSVLVTHNDKIILTGHISNPSGLSSSINVIRLLPNGTPDNSFNGNGSRAYYKNLNHDSTFVIPNAVAVHPDSSIYIVGSAVNISGGSSAFIVRIKQNSFLDSTISTEGSGWYYNNHGGLNAVLNDIFIAADSTVFVAGGKESIGTNNDILVAAYKRLPDTAGIVYTFNGNGLWTDAANWINNLIPPTVLPNGATIIIDPLVTGNCILNVQQEIAPGGKFVVRPGKKLSIEGNFKIGN